MNICFTICALKKFKDYKTNGIMQKLCPYVYIYSAFVYIYSAVVYIYCAFVYIYSAFVYIYSAVVYIYSAVVYIAKEPRHVISNNFGNFRSSF